MQVNLNNPKQGGSEFLAQKAVRAAEVLTMLFNDPNLREEDDVIREVEARDNMKQSMRKKTEQRRSKEEEE